MNNQILCPHCKKSIPLSDALSHEIREEFRQQAIDYKRKTDAEYKQKLEDERLKYENEKLALQKTAEELAFKKVQSEMTLKLEDTKNESEELKKEKKMLQDQLIQLNKTLRQMSRENESAKLELEKKLNLEQDRIRQEERRRIDEEYKLKIAEKEKQLDDTKKALADAQRKSEQGSQQLQGEVLELEIENSLKTQFPHDEIRAVAKGVRGGDVIQIVKSNTGLVLGTILWELKRTRDWSNTWIPKLKNDQRQMRAEVAVIISDVIPPDIQNFGYKDGVWVGNFGCFIGLAYAVHHNIVDVARLRSAAEGKKEKMEVLYNYVYGIEFRQRIEAIVEAFEQMQKEVDQEKNFFAKKWAREDKNIRRVLDNTFGMRGDLESITGKEIEGGQALDSLPSGEEPQQDILL